MPRRRELKNVAHGLAGRFISRNNDIGGYWGMGVLYKLTREKSSNKVKIDLLAGSASPELRCSKRLAASFYAMLREQLDARGFEEYIITAAVVELEFNMKAIPAQILSKNTWGEQFVCRVVLTDDRNKKYVHEVRGWCGEHDPRKEHKSAR